jgi:hypothetical protein
LKKWIPIILGALLLIAAAVWFFTRSESEQRKPSPFRAIPAQVGLCVEFESLSTLKQKLETTEYGYLINSSDSWFELERDLSLLDTLLIKGAGLESPDQVVCGWFPRNDEVIPLYVLDLGSALASEELEAKLSGQTHPSFSCGKTMLINREVINVQVSGQNLSYSIIAIDGGIVVSRDVKLLELSLDAMEQTGSLQEVKGFNKAYEKSAGKGDLRLIIHYPNLPSIASYTFSNAMKGVTAYWGNMASVSCYGVVLDANILGFNGFTYTGDSSRYHLSSVSESEPAQISLPKLLPNETVMFSAYGQATPSSYFNTITRSPGLDFKSYFQSWTTGQWAYFRWDDGLQHRDGLIIEVDPQGDPMADMEGLKRFAGLEHELLIDSSTGMAYSQVYSTEILPSVFPSPVYELGSPFYTMISNYLVFGESTSVLRELVLSQKMNQTLGKHPNYQVVTANTGTSSNSFTFINTAAMQTELGQWLNFQSAGGMESTLAKWQSFTPITLQFSKLGDLIFSHGQVHFKPEGFLTDYVPLPGRSDSLLISLPDSLKDTIHSIDQLPDEYFRITPVKSHATESGYLFGQDHTNTIYLITVGGDTLHTRQIDGPILGPIETVDYYLNGKIQYLFNTAERLYLIDRNFNDVAAYPIDLPVNASNGVRMVYYPEVKKHRFFLGGSDGNIYGYTKEGNQLSGWFPKTGVGVVKLQMQYVQAAGKDYLIFVNQNGVVHAFERDGAYRFDPVETAGTFTKPFIIETSSTGFVMSNMAGGKLVTINQDGELAIE